MLNMPIPKTRDVIPPHKRKVLLVDDHPIVREGLAKRINAENDLQVCGEAPSVAESLRAIERDRPDIVVLDLAFPQSHGLDLIKEIHAQKHQVPTLVFTMYDETAYAARALKAGARGYVTKHESSESLLSAIRTVLNGEFAISPQFSKIFIQSTLKPQAGGIPTVESLGDRELEVFELIGMGLGTRRIAQKLNRSVKTIETYQARIKRKLNLENSAELMRHAVLWVEKAALTSNGPQK